MHQPTTERFPLTIGLDLGSRTTQCAIYGTDCKRMEERKVPTTPDRFTALFERFPGARIVMEASTPTRWVHKLATELGHEVVVANPRSIPVITSNVRKSDRNDARLLAEIGQAQPGLLSPVRLREDRYQNVRVLLFARAQLVKQRTALVTFVRAEARTLLIDLPQCSTDAFVERCRPLIPEHLKAALFPLFDAVLCLSEGIKTQDARIADLSKREFPETAALRQVHGVGPLVALAFVATVGDPSRFRRSRSVGAYMGLVPRISQSGKSDPALSITKCGDHYMRALLVSSATRILGPHGADSDLRRFGERIAAAGGKSAKSRARIAVARKLSVLLHALLKSGQDYEPLRETMQDSAA